MTEQTYTRDQVEKSLQESLEPLRFAMAQTLVRLNEVEQQLLDVLDLKRWGAIGD